MISRYKIRHVIDPTLFWSKDKGWIDLPHLCESYTALETMNVVLPPGGEWFLVGRVWED